MKKFNLSKLLMYEEPVFGLSINEDKMRILYVLSRGEKISCENVAEIELEEEVIEEGKLKKPDVLIKKLKELVKISKIKLKRTGSAIISLPGNLFYINVLSFSKVLTKEQIEESIKLNIDFILPKPSKEFYFDWEDIQSIDPSREEVLLAAAYKSEIDKYTQAIENIGITPVAVEPNVLAISRVMDLDEKITLLISISPYNNLELAIFENKHLRFLRCLKLEKDFEDVLIQEVLKVINFYQTDRERAVDFFRILLVGKDKKINEIKKNLEKEFNLIIEKAKQLPIYPPCPFISKDNSILSALGTGVRGIIPRVKDTIISCLPIGTEKAYEERRKFSFIRFLSDLTVILSLFIIFIYSIVWLILSITYKNIELNLRIVSLPKTLKEIRETAVEFNKKSEAMVLMEKQIMKTSPILEKIKKQLPEGVILSRIDIPSFKELITLRGLALNRELLIKFRDNLAKSDFVKDVYVPLEFFELKENINFTLTFLLK